MDHNYIRVYQTDLLNLKESADNTNTIIILLIGTMTQRNLLLLAYTYFSVPVDSTQKHDKVSLGQTLVKPTSMCDCYTRHPPIVAQSSQFIPYYVPVNNWNLPSQSALCNYFPSTQQRVFLCLQIKGESTCGIYTRLQFSGILTVPGTAKVHNVVFSQVAPPIIIMIIKNQEQEFWVGVYSR